MNIYRTTADFEHLHQTAGVADQTDPVDVIRGCIQALVSIPAAVRVKVSGCTVIVQVHPADVERLVGPSGRNARALRTLLTAIGSNQRKRYALDLPELSDMTRATGEQSGNVRGLAAVATEF